jgi:chemotaxis protein MotA
MDLSTIIGVAVAVGAILGGQLLEGGHLSTIVQPTAALIVVGGTLGAIAVQFPAAVLGRTLRELRQVVRPERPDLDGAVATLVALATRARREGLVSIEAEAERVSEPFLRRALGLAVDGAEARTLRATLELEIDRVEEEREQSARVLEAAGGYSPTVGILGAVLGLIHVMENLSDPSKLGAGIAVAFVATIYGVALANLVYLPVAGKLKIRAREQVLAMEVVLEGVATMVEGESPRALEDKLSIYVAERRAGAPRPTVARPMMRSAA